MLARRGLADEFDKWNRKWGAPFGKSIPGQRFLKSLERALPLPALAKLRGPFGFQANNTSRAFEYPWAFTVVPIRRGESVVEIGGGLSGFQFCLDKAGCTVLNVDPDREGAGAALPLSAETFQTLNRAFGTHVRHLPTTLAQAGIPPNSQNRIVSISVIEHLADSEIEEIMETAFVILKPSGLFIMTIDLFLNLRPFTKREANEYGRNRDVRALISLQPWEITFGNRHELYGFDEFSADSVLSNLEQFLIGSYPVLTQCLVLKKPA